MSKESRSKKSRDRHCRECGKPIRQGYSTIKVTYGMTAEMGVNAVYYIIHEKCLDPLTLVLTMIPEGYVTLEKSVLRGL